MTDREVCKANFIDGEMQSRYFSNGGKFMLVDVENAYDQGLQDGRREVQKKLIEAVSPKNDMDTIYLEVISIIGEIE